MKTRVMETMRRRKQNKVVAGWLLHTQVFQTNTDSLSTMHLLPYLFVINKIVPICAKNREII